MVESVDFNTINSLIIQYQQIQQTKISITNLLTYGTLEVADTALQLEILGKKQIEIQKQLVTKIHVTNDGIPRTIKYDESKELWSTKMPDGKRRYGKTIDSLYEKILTYYGVAITDVTLDFIFEEAIKHKDQTEAVNPQTLYHLRTTYERFVDNSLRSMDIRKVTCDILAEYTLNQLRSSQYTDEQGVIVKIKKSAFLDYKTVLNLIFDYALCKDIINVNPLNKLKNKAFFKECDCSKAIAEDKIFSQDEIELIKKTVRSRMAHKTYNGYFINGYAILLAIETGMRVGELCAIKWSDIKSNYIHIHTQQLSNKREGGQEYYLADWTKDEKGESRGGRKFPLTNNIRELLLELKSLQQEKKIESDFIFCHEDGTWIKKDAYITCLRRLLRSLGFNISNNHAFRMSLNSNVLAGELDLPVAKRAELLGHSVETNMAYYTYASKTDMDELVELFNGTAFTFKPAKFQVVAPRSHLKLVN